MRGATRRLIAVTAALVAIIGTGASAAHAKMPAMDGGARAAGFVEGNIVNLYAGRCLEGRLDAVDQDVTDVQLWDCFGDQTANQVWTLVATATNTNAYQIKNNYNGRCLEPRSDTVNGTPIQLSDCGGPAENWQYWSVTRGQQRGVFQIKNIHSGRCLDAQFQSLTVNGTKIQLWDCLGATQYNQLWRIH